MLEFQEGFFDQEVRNGFYLDTTMKTLWAAELEVLQKVAEVCDRHGLKWYAAYGTLLGAIRHEGFVPWDDDMDIWVKRPDYNILMQVLPKELPEGYLVRSPMTDEGYDQYHTCLNSGNGISITKEWLEQYHGCPFTVGLDIFPLDYLPRDEKERKLQESLLAMTGRIAQLAKNVGRGDYDSEDSESEKDEQADGEHKTTLKESIIEEINLGIEYLEENCKLQIDHQLLEDEKWDKVSSELWKWANYLAMMYSEEESDYLVEYLSYIQWKHVFPKEWFTDGYSAKFENFMIPVPMEYDKILRRIYKNYFRCIRKSGTHEYPFYARQLRQLREYVKNIQQRAQDVGLVSIDDIDVKEDTKELLPEWLPLVTRMDGTRKKIILSANDPAVYATYGHRALDKLEQEFELMKQAKDTVLLWWRPHPVMKKILDQVSIELGARYQEILERYKAEGWGICDETDNTDRAAYVCDLYYGEMNAIIQPFQNENKPVVIATMENTGNQEENEKRIREYKAYISISDLVEENGKIYCPNANYNAFAIVDKETRALVEQMSWTGYEDDIQGMHLRCVKQQDRICFLPAVVQCLHMYDINSGEQKTLDFLGKKNERATIQESWDSFMRNDKLYLLPCHCPQGLWSLEVQAEEPLREGWWNPPSDNGLLKHGTMDSDRFYSLETGSGRLYVTNVVTKTVDTILLPDSNVQHIAYDGENFWYTLKEVSDIVCWNWEKGIVDRYLAPLDSFYGIYTDAYLGICFAGGHLFLLTGEGRYLYTLDREKGTLQMLHDTDCDKGGYWITDMTPHFKIVGNKLTCTLQNAGEMLIIDLDSLKVEHVKEILQMELPVKEVMRGQSYKLLLDRQALLFEEKGLADLNMAIQYCETLR